MIANVIKKDLFSVPPQDLGDLNRKNSIAVSQIYDVVNQLILENESLKARLAVLESSTGFVGKIYVVDADQNTVEIQVLKGKLINGTVLTAPSH